MSQDPTLNYAPPPEQGLLTQLKIVSILLIVCGALGWIVSLVDLAFRIPNFSRPVPPGPHPAGFEAGYYGGLYGMAICEGLTLLLAPIMIFGAVRMLQRRGHGMAMAGAILAIIPFTTTCCHFLNAPLGIWALILLTRPAVKAAFEA